MDADTGMIMASTLTGNDVGDPSQVVPLLDQIDATIASVTADGAYDGMPTYDVVASHGQDIDVIIPPHVTAVLSPEAGYNPSQRDQHILSIAAQARLGWQKETDYFITSGIAHDRLKWISPTEAKVLITEIIPAHCCQQTLSGRRKRFYAALQQEVAKAGWTKRQNSPVFEMKPPDPESVG